MPNADTTATVYTQKQLVLIDTSIADFYEKFQIPVIQNLEFNFPHVRILGTHQCGKERLAYFKLRGYLHENLCQCDYSEQVVSSFSHQILSEYDDKNKSLYTEGIELNKFSAFQQTSSLLSYSDIPRQYVFHYFFSDDRKQDSDTTAEHS